MSLSENRVGPVMATADLKRSREFYEEKLGLSPGEATEDSVSYECGGGTGLFVYVSQENAGKSTATLAGWAVDDLEKVVDELSSNGVAFERYEGEIETDEKGIFEADGIKVAWFKDPDGNIHAINQT